MGMLHLYILLHVCHIVIQQHISKLQLPFPILWDTSYFTISKLLMLLATLSSFHNTFCFFGSMLKVTSSHHQPNILSGSLYPRPSWLSYVSFLLNDALSATKQSYLPYISVTLLVLIWTEWKYEYLNTAIYKNCKGLRQ